MFFHIHDNHNIVIYNLKVFYSISYPFLITKYYPLDVYYNIFHNSLAENFAEGHCSFSGKLLSLNEDLISANT